MESLAHDRTIINRVLIVDDTALLREIYSTVLRRRYKNITIDYAQNGQEALDKVKASDYSVIISDVKMPVMNGIEFLKCLKRESPWIIKKIIFVSACTSEEQSSFIKEEGCSYLNKSFNNNDFLRIVDLILEEVGEGEGA